MGITVLSLFDGISCGRVALEKLNIKIKKYYSSEIDKYPAKIAKLRNPNIIELGSVENVGFIENVDLLIGGSPCQDLSRAKSNPEGLKGNRSSLFWEYVRIKNINNPKYFLFENVVPANKEDIKTISDALGVDPVFINSDLFVPQNRPRLYWTNIPIKELPVRPNWNLKYFQYRRTYWRELKSGVCCCLTANMGTGGNNVPYILENGEKRVLKIEELEELQGLPKGYTEGISNTQRKKAIGNGWTVDVIAHILSGLNQEIKIKKEQREEDNNIQFKWCI